MARCFMGATDPRHLVCHAVELVGYKLTSSSVSRSLSSRASSGTPSLVSDSGSESSDDGMDNQLLVPISGIKRVFDETEESVGSVARSAKRAR